MVAIRRQNGEEHSLDAETKATRPMVLAGKTKEQKNLLRLQMDGDTGRCCWVLIVLAKMFSKVQIKGSIEHISIP